MSPYSEYLARPDFQPFMLNADALQSERKAQLRRISKLRGDRDVLVFAADLNKQIPNLPLGITYADLLPITDQLSTLKGRQIDLILETPGGLGEAAEDIVHLIRQHYRDFAIIVPGWAKSAGTIMAMAADEILMGGTSALGPIDAQMAWQGKQFSADALLSGLKKIKDEVQSTGVLNKAYIPILQNLSPGELQDAQNALDFATDLVTDWLARYKFKDWNTHSSTGQRVTDEEKKRRANEIALQLCDHAKWRTHARSIKLADLEAMRLKVNDYSKQPELNDAITRYYALLHITFSGNLYKIYETVDSQVMKVAAPTISQQMVPAGFVPAGVASADHAGINFVCDKCKTVSKLQANFGHQKTLMPGFQPFPTNNKFVCPTCKTMHDLTVTRRQIEAQAGRPVV